jgi:hypothetical protein
MRRCRWVWRIRDGGGVGWILNEGREVVLVGLNGF